MQAVPRGHGAAMPVPIPNLRIECQPVRWFVGLLAGLVFGPLIACLLFFLPSNDWTGPYTAYEDFIFGTELIGFCYGLLAGLAVTLTARVIQRWRWTRPKKPWASSEPRPSMTALEANEHVYVRDARSGPPEEGIVPTP